MTIEPLEIIFYKILIQIQNVLSTNPIEWDTESTLI